MTWVVCFKLMSFVQHSELEREIFRVHLLDKVKYANQLLYIDEMQKVVNAAWRRRAWPPKGITPVIEAYFAGDHSKWYMLIGSCGVHGFVLPACELMEREHSDMYSEPELTHFERYIE
jgi:hypothetical protein